MDNAQAVSDADTETHDGWNVFQVSNATNNAIAAAAAGAYGSSFDDGVAEKDFETEVGVPSPCNQTAQAATFAVEHLCVSQFCPALFLLFCRSTGKPTRYARSAQPGTPDWTGLCSRQLGR